MAITMPRSEALKMLFWFIPFLPEARLLLAKVLLVRGAAGRDLATLKLAKLMLEMALAMQPELLEATQLLELLSSELPSAQAKAVTRPTIARHTHHKNVC